MQYKDIINFNIIKKFKEHLNNICILYNNLLHKDSIKKRESEYYEVYTQQYLDDIKKLTELRDNCLHLADLCNKTLLVMNTYHIKQYYLDKEELSEYEFKNEYDDQFIDEE